MRTFVLIVLTFAVLIGCTAKRDIPSNTLSGNTADAIYTNGRIWTGNPGHPWAVGLAVQDGKIVAIGSNDHVLNWRGHDTDYYDLAGKFVAPGIQDSHIHLLYISSAQVDLAGAQNLAQIQKRIRDFAAANTHLPWIQGFGWGYSAFPENRPLAEHLDAAVSDRPVFMASRDGHMALTNTLAMKMAEIDTITNDPENGRIIRDPTGAPTGEFQEQAMDLIRQYIPKPTKDQRYHALLATMEKAAAAGITALHQAGTDPENIPLFERALTEKKLSQRVELALRIISPEERTKVPVDKIKVHVSEAIALRERLNGPYLRVRSIKGILDGTIDATTAAMFENYIGTNTRGLPFWELDTLKQTIAMYDKAGFQVMLHAIGDRAISQALDAFDYAQQTNGFRDSRHRIEHAEMPRLTDLGRFRELGVIASTQPMFAYPDATVLENFSPLLGHERTQYADNYALFDDASVRQVFGSDNPVMTLSVLSGIETAVTRMTETGTPPGGWYPDGRISVEAALRHYTSDSAWSIHDELTRGTLEVGKFADFVVLSENILTIDPTQISETRVLKTVMDGQITFMADL